MSLCGLLSRRRADGGCRQRLFLLLAVCAAGLAALPVLAAAGPETGRPGAAKAIIARYCISCHAVPGFKAPKTAAELGAPSFAEIADDPERYSEQRLRTVLARPHFPMQKFILSPSDVNNLISYIQGMRAERRRVRRQ